MNKVISREYVEKNYIKISDLKEIIYPTPENPISLEIQMSAMYKKLEKLLEATKDGNSNENNNTYVMQK